MLRNADFMHLGIISDHADPPLFKPVILVLVSLFQIFESWWNRSCSGCLCTRAEWQYGEWRLEVSCWLWSSHVQGVRWETVLWHAYITAKTCITDWCPLLYFCSISMHHRCLQCFPKYVLVQVSCCWQSHKIINRVNMCKLWHLAWACFIICKMWFIAFTVEILFIFSWN